ncbi:MAG: hypothetical protein RR420_00900 [Anaerovoracaceae bacterium]
MKIKIYAKVITEFDHEIVVDVQDGTDIDDVLDKIEGKSYINQIEDFKAELEESGCKIIDFIEDGSGDGKIESDYCVQEE